MSLQLIAHAGDIVKKGSAWAVRRPEVALRINDVMGVG